jgi:pimeloyl-ACP methyl ester carboxylesterase
VASAVGICHGRPQSFGEAMKAFLALDAVTFLRLVLLAEAHDATDWLSTIRVPTLVTAGDRDLITPPRIARATAAQIPGACYFEVPGGTHYSVMEFPRLMANRIDSFLEGSLDLRAARSAC